MNEIMGYYIYPSKVSDKHIEGVIELHKNEYYTSSFYYGNVGVFDSQNQKCNTRDPKVIPNQQFTFNHYSNNPSENYSYYGAPFTTEGVVELTPDTPYCLQLVEIDRYGTQFYGTRAIPISTAMTAAIAGIYFIILLSSMTGALFVKIPGKKIDGKGLGIKVSSFFKKGKGKGKGTFMNQCIYDCKIETDKEHFTDNEIHAECVKSCNKQGDAQNINK